MKIRHKTIYIVFTTIFALLIILFITFETILMNGFKLLEREGTERNVQRVIEAINEVISNLSIKAADWAKWDDTYQFIEDTNQAYINSNLNDEVFSDLKINFMLFFNSKGNLIFGRECRNDSGWTNEISEELLVIFKNQTQLFTYQSVSDFKSGIVFLPGKPTFITSRPIITSEGNGPSRGTLIFGKFIDKNEIDKLSHITHVSVSINLLDSKLQPDLEYARKSISENKPIFINPISKDLIAGYALLKDINEESLMIVRVDTPRDIYKQGNITKMYLIITILLSGLVFGFVLNHSLEKNVISRLSRLNEDVKSISDSEDNSLRVSYSGNDELTFLSTSINNMLQTLQRSEIKLLNQNRQMRLIMDTLPSGLLTLDEYFNINPEYSQSVEIILGQKSLSGKSFFNVLYPEANQHCDREKLLEFLDVLRQDLFPENELAALNPAPLVAIESANEQRWLRLCYHKINRGSGLENHTLVDIEDITAQKRLENKIKLSEQENLQLKIIAEDPDLFRFFLSDMNQVITHAKKNLTTYLTSTDKQKELLLEIYRDVHTIKGTASSFGLSIITVLADDLETCFHHVTKEDENISTEIIACATKSVEQLSQAIQKEIENTRKILGEDIGDDGNIFLKLSVNKFNQLYTVIEGLVHKEITDPHKMLQFNTKMRMEFLELRTVPVRKGLAKALKIVPELQKRFTTDIKFILEGGDLLIDCVIANQLNTPLIHLIRNAFVHGIEPFEERFISGKNNEAHIIVNVEKTDREIKVLVTDDGRGINPDYIKQIAIKNGFISEEQTEKFSKKQLLELIFINGFTTTEKATEISGRGIGMNAVYNSVVNELGGSLEIQSEINVGTTFTVKIPSKRDKFWSISQV